MDEPRPQPDTDAGGEWIPLGRARRVRAADVEITFTGASGPGGQNVNKRATRAQLRVPVEAIPLDAPAQRRLRALAGSRLTQGDEILIACGVHRTARRNRSECVARLAELVIEAAKKPTVRRPTRPSRGARERRLEAKRQRSEKKRARRWKPDG